MENCRREDLAFFKLHVPELECQGRDQYRGVCPACKRRELRIKVSDITPSPWRCGYCGLGGWGTQEFVEIMGKRRLPCLKGLARDPESQKALEAREMPPDEVPAKPEEIEVKEEPEKKREQKRESAEYWDSLLSNGHPRRIGPAIWVWLFFCREVEGSYKDHRGRKWGIVKSLSLQQITNEMALILDQSKRNIRNHLNRLKYHNYIQVSDDTEGVYIVDLQSLF